MLFYVPMQLKYATRSRGWNRDILVQRVLHVCPNSPGEVVEIGAHSTRIQSSPSRVSKLLFYCSNQKSAQNAMCCSTQRTSTNQVLVLSIGIFCIELALPALHKHFRKTWFFSDPRQSTNYWDTFNTYLWCTAPFASDEWLRWWSPPFKCHCPILNK